MITEHDLQEAIAECQGERNPNANTCIKMAAYYTLMDHLSNKDLTPTNFYSYASEIERDYDSDTEFFNVIKNLDRYKVWSIIDELVTTLSVVNPRLYSSLMSKLYDAKLS